MGVRKHERDEIDWVVRFDNGATHHESDYTKAMRFALEMGDVHIYGKPVAITKHTVHITSTYEDVYEF